jgi:hypothetical protein
MQALARYLENPVSRCKFIYSIERFEITADNDPSLGTV